MTQDFGVFQKARKWLCPGFRREPHYVPYPLGPNGLCGTCKMEMARLAK
jgi:hypothetical protein